MKRLIIATCAFFVLVSCTTGGSQTIDQPEASTIVYYFHGKQRCKTCVAIERLSAEVVNNHFSDAVASGKLAYRVVDYTDAENQPLADRYEVGWSSLIVAGSEGWENLTDMAFSCVLKDSAEFVHQLSNAIEEKLK